jgi:hypothetical protein
LCDLIEFVKTFSDLSINTFGFLVQRIIYYIYIPWMHAHNVPLHQICGFLGMGEGARRRLQFLAANFEQKINNISSNNNNNSTTGGGGNVGGMSGGGIGGSVLQEAGGAAAERRGLLDDDDDDGEDMIEFETRKKRE